MNVKLRFLMLVAILVLTTLISTGATLGVLYHAELEEERGDLLDLVNSQARTFEAIANQAAAGSGSTREARTDRAIAQAFVRFDAFSDGRGIAAARAEGREVRYIAAHRGTSVTSPGRIPADSAAAQPVLLALDGKVGTMIGERPDGKPVLLAYNHLKDHKIALVASLELSALQGPFLEASAQAAVVAIILIVIGALIFNRAFGQILSNLEKEVKQRTAELAHELEDRKAREEALRQSEEKFRRAFEDAQTGVLLADPDGHILTANRAFCDMVGYEERELIGLRPSVDLTHPEDVEHSIWKRRSALQKSGVNSVREEKRYMRKDGTPIWASVSYSFIRNEDGQHLYTIGLVEDISERKHSEIALAESEERFRRSFEDATIPMSVAEVTGKFIQVNRALCEFLGYSEAELKKMSVGDILIAEDAAASNRERAEAATGQFHVRSVERRYRHKDGHILYGIANRAVVTDANGNPVSIITQVQDISERMAAEELKSALENELRQTQKMEAIGQLAAGIAHEINTPIQYIGDNLKFVERATEELSAAIAAYREFAAAARRHDELIAAGETLDKSIAGDEIDYLLAEVPVSVHQSLEGIEQVAQIVSAMREFSHPGQKEKSPADINRALQNTIMVCRNAWKQVAHMETDLDPQLPHVECLIGEINQVFLNLIVNASQAIEEMRKGAEGRIAVSTRRDGNWVEIRVTDNGPGVPPEIQGRIFEPFFTTKDVGKGTGQGLSMCYDVVVKKHGGKIACEAENGGGAIFVVRLPILDARAESKAA